MTEFRASRKAQLEGTTIGLPSQCWQEHDDSPVRSQVREAITQLEKYGARVQPGELPSPEAAIPTYYLLTSAEAASNLSRFEGIRFGSRSDADDLMSTYIDTRTAGFGPEVQRRILLGTFALAEGWADDLYRRADAVRSRMRTELDASLQTVDVLAMPTAPTTAFRLGEKTSDPIEMYLSDIYTNPPSLTGHPAISVPAGSVNGLPVGLQLIGRRGDEGSVFRFGMAMTGA